MTFHTTIIGVLFLLFGLMACAREPAIRGHLIRPYQLQELSAREGIKQNDVMKEVGSPSFESEDGRMWYYVSYRSNPPTLFPEEIEDIEIIIVSFDESQKLIAVKDMRKSTWMTKEEIEMADERTSHPDGEILLFRELFGRIGAIDFRNQLE